MCKKEVGENWTGVDEEMDKPKSIWLKGGVLIVGKYVGKGKNGR